MSEKFAADNGRPVEANHLEIADTFQDAGTRPIEESSEPLVSKSPSVDQIKKEADLSSKHLEEQHEINNVPPLD